MWEIGKQVTRIREIREVHIDPVLCVCVCLPLVLTRRLYKKKEGITQEKNSAKSHHIIDPCGISAYTLSLVVSFLSLCGA